MSVGLLEKLTQTGRRVSLAGLLIVLTGAAALVFASIAITATSRSIPSEIALACALAFATSASTSSVAAKKSRARRREAYNSFLTSSDRLVEAEELLKATRRGFDDASDEFQAAQKKHALFGNADNASAAIEANKRWSVAKNSWTAARTAAKNRQEEYDAAKQAAGKVARDSVRTAFEEFGSCPPQDTPRRDLARSAFVRDARLDVRIRARADESTL
jgi:hypothetical protein